MVSKDEFTAEAQRTLRAPAVNGRTEGGTLMQRVTMQSLLSLIVAGLLIAAQNPAIGLAMARGSFRVNNSQVWGNATLVEGTVIETAQVASELRLNSGTRLALAAESRGRVHKDRLILERGTGELREARGYGIEARRLRVYSAASGALARVAYDKDNRVLVAALNGPVRVTTDGGLLVANIAAGKALSFDPQPPGAAPPVKVTGKLERKDGHFLLTDETTQVISELVGAGLDQEVGNRIEVTGVLDPTGKPFPPATQLVKLLKRTRLAAVPPPAAAAGGWAGLATGAKAAIIAGIVVGGTVGILAAADVIFKEEKKPVSP
ncbi:MAG: hypothetical protein ACUVXB_15510 [Bryobacteraceae bacterium]